MFFFKNVVCLVVISFIGLTSSSQRQVNATIQDAIGFPESEENSNLKNRDNRQPVYIPSMCPENELYYPGDQKDDWICDCRPAYLYHPRTDKCWAAWKRGPCNEGQYLVLPPNSVLPTCETNHCNIDGYVYFNNNCEPLGSKEPCANIHSKSAVVLGVNGTTMAIQCIILSIDTRNGVAEPVPDCPPSSKRSVNGKCPHN